MLLCFIWSEKASDYVDTYWDILEEVLDGSMADPVALKEMMYANASAAGGICMHVLLAKAFAGTLMATCYQSVSGLASEHLGLATSRASCAFPSGLVETYPVRSKRRR